eukprot:2784113-Alexandrium_andersonii.AAC.1
MSASAGSKWQASEARTARTCKTASGARSLNCARPRNGLKMDRRSSRGVRSCLLYTSPSPRD